MHVLEEDRHPAREGALLRGFGPIEIHNSCRLPENCVNAYDRTLKQYNGVVRNKMDICIDQKEISDILRSSSPDFQRSAARILYARRH